MSVEPKLMLLFTPSENHTKMPLTPEHEHRAVSKTYDTLSG